jgi:hypothetical protein
MEDVTGKRKAAGNAPAGNREELEKESLKEEMNNILGECRMVLPGIQALFGFQTVAVFNQRFTDLSTAAMAAHLVSLGLVAVSIAMSMAPAAYHRIAEPGKISRHLIARSTHFICAGMVLLMLGVALEMFVVFELATDMLPIGVAVAAATLAVFAIAWFIFPYYARLHLQRKRADHSHPTNPT